MVAYLTKSDASEGFNQAIDFLNKSYLKYALTVNPNIYVSCIKQFWNTIAIKQVNDVTRLQALVDKTKVVVTEATIREVLRLDDAEGVDCLPNEEIFTELARMGYEKPSTKLTFYKAFFSSLSSMTSAVICLSTDRKFNFSKYIFDSLKVFANMRRVWKGFSGVKTPFFEGMLIGHEIDEEGDADEHVEDVTTSDDAQGDDTAAHGEVPTVQPPSPQPQAQQQATDFPTSLLQEALDACAVLTRRAEHLVYDKVAQALEIMKLKRRVKKLEKGNKARVLKIRRLQKVRTSQRVDTSDDTVMDDESNQGRMIDEMDKDDAIVLMDEKDEEKKVKEAKVDESAQEDEPAKVQEVVDVVTTAKLIIEVVTAASKRVTAASAIIFAVEPQVPAATITIALTKVVVAPNRRRKGVIEMDEEYARKLHAELNKDIDWDVAIDHVKLKAKEDPAVQRYQVIKRKLQTEAQDRKNMMMYLKNVTGFKLDYFKGVSYDDIRPIFKAKRRKLNDEVEDLKRHLEIVPDEDDDVYTHATLLARKVPVMDHEIIELNNKPYYKIIRADGTHQLYISFMTLLKKFDREDLKALWSLVKE
nr:xylulose kinase-1 [Tanacetum cinerariifolium]